MRDGATKNKGTSYIMIHLNSNQTAVFHLKPLIAATVHLLFAHHKVAFISVCQPPVTRSELIKQLGSVRL